MPTYDYHCESCGLTFEWFQAMSAPKLTHCPEELCQQPEKGKGVVERKISGGAGLVFNGDGFYLTDYVKKPEATSSSSSSKKEKAADVSEKSTASESNSTPTATPSTPSTSKSTGGTADS